MCTSCKTCLYLIKDKNDVVLVAEFANAFEVPSIRKNDCKVLENWFDDKAGDLLCILLEHLLECFDVVKGNNVDIARNQVGIDIWSWLIGLTNLVDWWLAGDNEWVVATVVAAFDLKDAHLVSCRTSHAHRVHR